MDSLGKLLVAGGLLLAVAGAAIWLLGALGLSPGRLPGDIVIGDGQRRFVFPVVTCIVISVVLTVVLNLVLRMLAR